MLSSDECTHNQEDDHRSSQLRAPSTSPASYHIRHPASIMIDDPTLAGGNLELGLDKLLIIIMEYVMCATLRQPCSSLVRTL